MSFLKQTTHVAVTVSCLLAGCANPQPKPAREPVISAKTSAAAGHAPKPAAKPAGRKVTKALPAEAEYNLYYARLVVPENDFTDKDRATFNAMPAAPAGGSVHEAALVVGMLRDVLSPVSATTTAPKETVPPATPGVNSSNPSAVIATPETSLDTRRILESRSREKGVDLASALAGNSYLKNQAVYNMVWDAVRIEGNSQAFVQNVAVILRTETRLWTDFAKRLGLEPAQESKPVITDTTPAASGTEPATPAETPVAPLSASANEEALKSLNKAMDLAQKENFEKAVIEARKVPQGSDQYATAQENIKTWSNKAVQELRRQAANNFRAGTSTNDPGAKKTYLNKAKNSLQEALTKYPEASTLDTVKENLDIISSELERAN